MFGLVKASTLRQAEEDLSVARNERKEWHETADVWRGRSTNWQAIAESRLVAVLLLRDRYATLTKDVDTSTRALLRANADLTSQRDDSFRQVVDHERTIASMDERFNAVASAHDTAQEFNMKLSARMMDIEHILEAEQPPIETAIIRPSSTNRLRWRVNDDDGKALCQSSTGYATANDAGMAFARAAYMISLDRRAPEDSRIERIREVLTREPDVEPPEFPVYVDAQGNEHGEF